MMNLKSRLRRWLVVWVAAFAIVALAQWLKGHDPAWALRFAAIWGSTSAAVYALADVYRMWRHRACLLPGAASGRDDG